VRVQPDPESGFSPGSHDTRGHSSSPLLEISNATVRLYKAAFGRGPTHARARFAGPDTLVVLLQDTLTVSERRLVEVGEHERLRAHRLLLHQTVETEIRAIIEQTLGRSITSLICGLDPQRDIAVEVAVLAPATHAEPEVLTPQQAGPPQG